MKTSSSLLLLSLLILSACSNLDRSRDLANPNVRPEVTARQLCSDCHGVDGNSISPNFPKLAAQQEAYLVKQLQNFRHRDRASTQSYQYMWGMTASLTDEQIKGLAQYYSHKPMRASTSQRSDKAQLERGKEIFENGIPEKKAAPCQACHGSKGEGLVTFPRLAGQHQAYLERQLHIFQDNVGRPGTPMGQITHGLNSDEMEAVSSYLASLGG
jgi:cytochrome c553